jgi:hypothetical protein
MDHHTSELWSLLGGDPSMTSALRLSGGPVLPSRFDVTSFAQGAVGVASLAVSELHAARGGASASVEVSSHSACAAFRSEALQGPIGWELPPVWDRIAGDYRARDRWIRLHTNYAHHLAAVLVVLGLHPGAGRDTVAAAVSSWDAASLEAAVVAAGGCAAAMYSRAEWLTSEHGQATSDEQPLTLSEEDMVATDLERPRATGAPLAGVRVLDLSRVLAGPVCTRFLAAHGASVLRIDPPGFAEVPALVPDTSIGKRCASLDLGTDEGCTRLIELARQADVLVHGYRPGALERRGITHARLRAANPSLVLARLNAYGWRGPWSGRRGFDSLVQMSVGIAAASGEDRPSPLPAQALDHGTGYLLAAAVCRALTRRVQQRRVTTIHASLLGTANHLIHRGFVEPVASASPWPDEVFETVATAWGPLRRVRCPGQIEGIAPRWPHPPGPLGTSPPTWPGPGDLPQG